jgi:hypothetical protein
METIEKKIYDSKKYYENFKNKNKDKINIKVECPICLGSYSYYNKSSHAKNAKHKKHLLKHENENKNKNI